MNCTEFEIAAELAVETRTALGATAFEHLSDCADCRRSWELHGQLNAAIAAWRSIQPSAGLADAVLAELATPAGSIELDPQSEFIELREMWDERPRSSSVVAQTIGRSVTSPSTPPHTVGIAAPATPRKTRSSRFAMAAITACMVVAVVFMSRFGGNARNDLAQTRQARTTDMVNSDVPLDVSGTLNEVFSDLKSEYREMANETTAMAREMVSAIPHRVAISALPDSDKIELRPNSSDMVRMFEPIGTRVESALGFLWNAIPSDFPGKG